MLFGGTRRLFHSTRRAAFILRNPGDASVATVENAAAENMTSRRVISRSDGMGFSMQQEIFRKDTPVRLDFRNHVYALTVTQGHGEVRLLETRGGAGGKAQDIREGSTIALSASTVIEVIAKSDELHAVSVMNPPLVGSEELNEDGVFPAADEDGTELSSYDRSALRRLMDPPESLKAGTQPMKDHPFF